MPFPPLPPTLTGDNLTFNASGSSWSGISAPSGYTPVTDPATVSGAWFIEKQKLYIQYERVVTQNSIHQPVDNSGISLSGCNWDGIFGSGVVATPYQTALQCWVHAEYSTEKVTGSWSATIETPQLLQVNAFSADYKGQGYGTYPTGNFLGCRGTIHTTQPYYHRRPWKETDGVSGWDAVGTNYMLIPDPGKLRGEGATTGHLGPLDIWSNQLRSSCVETQNSDLSWGPNKLFPFGSWYLFKPNAFPLQGRYDLALENAIVSQGGEPWLDLIEYAVTKVKYESHHSQYGRDYHNEQGYYLFALNAQDTYINYGGLAGWQEGDIPVCPGYSSARHDYTGLFNG